MQAYSRRDIMRLLAMTSASIGAAEAGGAARRRRARFRLGFDRRGLG